MAYSSHRDSLSAVTNVLVDGIYMGYPFADAVQNVLEATVEVARRNELHTFAVTPKRWVVERSFAWLETCRRLWKNCGRKLKIVENLLDTRGGHPTLAGLSLPLLRYPWLRPFTN